MASTYTNWFGCNFGPGNSGYASSIVLTVVDAGGTTRSVSVTFAEETDATGVGLGSYSGTGTVSNAWSYPLKCKYTVTGQANLGAIEFINRERAATINDGYTAALANVGNTGALLTYNTTGAGAINPDGSGGVSATNTVAANVTKIGGTNISTPATAGILDVNVKNIGNAAVSTTSAQIGVNVVNIAGQAAVLDANNLLKVDVEDIRGTASAAVAGYIGPDWSHVNAPTTSVGLSGTTVGTTTYLTNAPTTGDLTATMKASVTAAVPTAAQNRAEMDSNSTQLAKLGTPAGASVSADIAAVETKLGSPAGASVSADVAALNTMLARLLGLSGENSGFHNFSYTGSVLNSFDVCLYDSAAHATTNDGSTGLLHKYTVSLAYSGSNLTGQTQPLIS